jgi:hypothetical protein
MRDWDQAGQSESKWHTPPSRWHIRALPAEMEYAPAEVEYLLDTVFTKHIIHFL